MACCADRSRSGWHPFEIDSLAEFLRSAFSLIYNASHVINFAQREYV